VQSLLPSDPKEVRPSKGGLEKSLDEPSKRLSMVQPIETVVETPMGMSQTKPMTKLQVGNALLFGNSGLMIPDRIKFGGSENQGATERQWQFENINMVTKGILAEDIMFKTKTKISEHQGDRNPTEEPKENDSRANKDLSPRLQS
jgi:hypothetical protein